MPELPPVLRELYRYFNAAALAHERMDTLRRELVELGGGGSAADRLLRASTDIVVRDLPAAGQEVRRLERIWTEQELLDPSAAQRTVEAMEIALAQIRPQLAALLARQRDLVSEMRMLVEQARWG